MGYEITVGLETHVELCTQTKIFCGCPTRFGMPPNTQCCPVCLGLPGSLPVLNWEVVRYGVLAGLALGCTINLYSRMARKNYFYPDLPKAYQITQYDKPLCGHGTLVLPSGKKIRIQRIHIEEDAGKLIHLPDEIDIDYNRCGVPLIEIVTEPDFTCAREAAEYVEQLRLIIKTLGISDCKMQEGSMRCDVNVSVRKSGENEPGVRTEIKNMNSLSYMVRAIEQESARQIALLENGKRIVRETRRFDEKSGMTQSMRGKENAPDYRYFEEPDLPPIVLTEREIDALRDSLPELPAKKAERYHKEFRLPEQDARLLVRYPQISEYFEAVCAGISTPQTAANLIFGPVFSRLKGEDAKLAFKPCVSAENFQKLVRFLESGKIHRSLARTMLETMMDTGKTFPEVLSQTDVSRFDEAGLLKLCKSTMAENEAAVTDYKNGKQRAVQVLIGAVMRASKGCADAALAGELLKELLNE